LALALAAGQAGHALLAAVAVTGSYLAGLAIRHHALLDSAVIVNVLTPFAVVAVAYPVQHWFALFVARGNGDVAFIDDMPRLRHPHAEHFAADAELVPAGVGNHPSVVRSSFPSKSRASTTLSFAERIALLDDEQLRIVDLAARGYRRRNIAQAMALSEPAIRVRRARAQQLTGTRSFEQLIGMYRHVQNRAAGQQHNA
jgi:DNA-binding CsgD family transcriptional regulator